MLTINEKVRASSRLLLQKKDKNRIHPDFASLFLHNFPLKRRGEFAE
jgi:hypothetical protein